jgi:hypothetical protein
MTPEQSAWDNLRPVLQGLDLDPHRVENVVGPGHPDVNYAGGDIELKAMVEWPKRPGTTVKVPHLTGEQIGWGLNRARAGGRWFLMVRVGSEWYGFTAMGAHAVYKGLTQDEWFDAAILVVPGTWSDPWRKALRLMLRLPGQ